MELKPHCTGTPLRIRAPSRVFQSYTNGWYTVIGDLGKGRPRLEIWFDLFPGYPNRRFYAGFRSEDRQEIVSLTKRLSKSLWPVREVGHKDIAGEKSTFLSRRLRRNEFNLPILEKYGQGRTFYGIYDPTRTTQDIVNPHFVIRAATFISDVVNTLTRTKVNEEQREVYPRCENRKRVASHVYRERNSYLATERKSQDRYKCYVCGFHYENLYGKLGVAFAEAHHLIPLNKVQGPRRTHIEDLVTVCANCHRMLHRMKGERGDVEKLKAIVRNNRKKRA